MALGQNRRLAGQIRSPGDGAPRRGAVPATQLGITLASLGLGWLGEPFIGHRIEPLLREFGITDPKVISSISFAIAFSIITFFSHRARRTGAKIPRDSAAEGGVAQRCGAAHYFLSDVFPFIWLLNGAANRFLRCFGLDPAGEGDHTFSSEELEYVFTQARHSHPGDALINRIMVRSLRLRSVIAQQVMRPREQIVSLWMDHPIAENLRLAQTGGFSRMPVRGTSLDDFKGILLVREWLWQIHALGADASFAPLVRTALPFTLKTPIHTMIELFRTSRNHLALVLNDDLKVAGIVSFEDVLEEIVGDIQDEFDPGHGPVFEHTATAIIVRGLFTMRELQAETGWDFEWQPRETVSAWAERHRGGALKRGESITTGDFRVTAVDVTAERVRRIRVERLPAERS